MSTVAIGMERIRAALAEAPQLPASLRSQTLQEETEQIMAPW